MRKTIRGEKKELENLALWRREGDIVSAPCALLSGQFRSDVLISRAHLRNGFKEASNSIGSGLAFTRAV